MIGKILAEYRIVEALGGRAGIEVYKAIGIDGRRPVAIKLFPFDLSRDKPRLQGLLDSLRKLSGLDLPGIPRLIGSGLNGGRAYVIMPFMTGGSLRDRLEIGQVSPPDALQLLERIAAALEQSHTLGVVHGHLSSNEVMFDDTGQMQIIGIGQMPYDVDPGQTDAESFIGEHVAPEVRNGSQPTPASDQYSLAVLAFELLTGQCVEKALGEAAPEASDEGKASKYGIALAPEVAEVLQRSLQEDPSLRFTGVAEMADALRQAMRKPASNDAALADGSTGRETSRTRRSLGRWGMASLAVAALGCFVLTLPALAAARWIQLELGSIVDLLPAGSPAASSTGGSGLGWDGLPEISPWVATPPSMGRPRAGNPTPIRMGELAGPTQIDAAAGDDDRGQAAPTALSAVDGPAEDPPQADAPAPPDDSIDGSAGADPAMANPGTATPSELQQTSPTPAPPFSTATSWNGCSGAAGQGCTDTLPNH